MLYLIGVLDKKNECLIATLNRTLRVLDTHIYNLVEIVLELTLPNIGRQKKSVPVCHKVIDMQTKLAVCTISSNTFQNIDTMLS